MSIAPRSTRKFVIAPWRKWTLVGIAILGAALQLWRTSDEVGFELSYVALVGVSLLSAWAIWIAIGNAVLGIAWIAWPHPWPEVARDAVRVPIVLMNRWVGHAEAILGWLTLSMVLWPYVVVQLPLAASIVLLGGPALDWVALRREREDDGDVSWARRPWIYVATVASLFVLYLLAPRQVIALLPLITAVGVGVVLRGVAAYVHGRRTGHHERAFKQRVVHHGRRLDPFVAAGVLVVACAVPLWFLFDARGLRRSEQADLRSRRAVCEDADPAKKPPIRADVSLFLVSDTQLHELDGHRSAGQLDLVDSLVPVAVRPIELDLLSESTFAHFAHVYHALQRPHIAWAHVGDFGDLGCEGELERMRHAIAGFGGDLAALVPGNHDSTFVGNFEWHPDWDRACPSGRLGKRASDTMLADMARDLLVPGAATDLEQHGPGLFRLATSFYATVSPLGTTTDHGAERGVVVIALDSSDRGSFQLGIAGVRGSLSEAQTHWVEAAAARLAHDNAAYAEPFYVVLLHHPIGELDRWGREELDELVHHLGPRVLAFVTSHTHLSARRYHGHWFEGRRIPEYVVGSTIDPPQEAALLDVGPNEAGVTSVRLQTLPAISRPGLTCNESEPTEATCKVAIDRLAGECPELFASSGDDVSPEAGDVGLATALKYFASTDHPALPWQVRVAQKHRAARLLACLCVRDGCTPPADALDDAAVFTMLREMSERRSDDLVCLSWAASVLQEFKHTAAGPHSLGAAARNLDLHTRDAILGAKTWIDTSGVSVVSGVSGVSGGSTQARP